MQRAVGQGRSLGIPPSRPSYAGTPHESWGKTVTPVGLVL